MKLILVTLIVGYGALLYAEVPNPIKDCEEAPNCASTRASNQNRHIQPIIFYGTKEEFKAKALVTIESLPRAKVITSTDNYIHVEFKSAYLNFIDDFEVFYDEAKKMIDMRSASRVGYYDFRVNINRTKEFKKLFLENTKK